MAQRGPTTRSPLMNLSHSRIDQSSDRSEEHTSELQSHSDLVCRLLLEKKNSLYVAKYVNKKSDMDLAHKGLGAKELHNSLKIKLSTLYKKMFSIRLSRTLRMKQLELPN